jgi:Protein of unknown function (DUF2845)
MNAYLRAALTLSVVALVPAAQAESLRCNGAIAAEGDSRLSVLYKCGQPVLADAYCEPVYYVGTGHLVPSPVAGAFAPCLAVEEWLYDRGPGNFMATVRIRAGVVQSIRYGRLPQ